MMPLVIYQFLAMISLE